MLRASLKREQLAARNRLVQAYQTALFVRRKERLPDLQELIAELDAAYGATDAAKAVRAMKRQSLIDWAIRQKAHGFDVRIETRN